MIKKIIYFLFFNLILISPSISQEIIIFEFTNQELEKLKVRKVRGADNKTSYSVGTNEKGNFLKADAENAASGLGKEVKMI